MEYLVENTIIRNGRKSHYFAYTDEDRVQIYNGRTGKEIKPNKDGLVRMNHPEGSILVEPWKVAMTLPYWQLISKDTVTTINAQGHWTSGGMVKIKRPRIKRPHYRDVFKSPGFAPVCIIVQKFWNNGQRLTDGSPIKRFTPDGSVRLESPKFSLTQTLYSSYGNTGDGLFTNICRLTVVDIHDGRLKIHKVKSHDCEMKLAIRHNPFVIQRVLKKYRPNKKIPRELTLHNLLNPTKLKNPFITIQYKGKKLKWVPGTDLFVGVKLVYRVFGFTELRREWPTKDNKYSTKIFGLKTRKELLELAESEIVSLI